MTPRSGPAIGGRVASRLPGVRADRVVALGEGTDHSAHLVDGRLVVRVAGDPDPARRAARVERDARVLDVVASVAPLPVPRPAAVVPDEGWLAYPLLPGVPLLEVAAARRSHPAVAVAVAGRLGALMRALRALPAERLAGLVDVDDVPPAEWRDEAAAHYGAVRHAIPAGRRADVEAFLAADPPAPAPRLALCHFDLGIEHVLVDPGTLAVTGVIDWSDAAVADPARDLGLVLRDLGPAALEAAAAALGPEATEDTGLRERALFLARCALLEDLAYGLEAGRPRYAGAALAGVGALFGPA